MAGRNSEIKYTRTTDDALDNYKVVLGEIQSLDRTLESERLYQNYDLIAFEGSLEQRMLDIFEAIVEEYNRDATQRNYPNIFHYLAQGIIHTDRLGPLRHIRGLGEIFGIENIKHKKQIEAINSYLCEETKNVYSVLTVYLRKNITIQTMLHQKFKFDGTTDLSPIGIVKLLEKEDSNEHCFIYNIIIHEAIPTILQPPMADVFSIDDATMNENVPDQKLPQAVLIGGKSRRSRKQKKRASKSKKSKKSRKTVRK
uniref:Uncharacterized protein n=1 Tax=viral metagenome TaxID=1070528 RepID=A0A6C0K2T6_9ZZZZ